MTTDNKIDDQDIIKNGKKKDFWTSLDKKGVAHPKSWVNVKCICLKILNVSTISLKSLLITFEQVKST